MSSLTVFNQELAQQFVNSDDQFPVDFDMAWQWMGYSSKQAAKKKLSRNFDAGTDYLSKWMCVAHSNGLTASRTEQIYLTIDCFKSLGMMAGTDQGKEIRKYFLKCERIVKEVIPVQSDRIRELELENENLKLASKLADSQQKLLASVHLLETVSPGLAPLALGKPDAVVERIEYIERTVTDKGTFEGVGITYIAKRFGFKSIKQAWAWLDSIGCGKDSGLWELQLTAVEAHKLSPQALNEIAKRFAKKDGDRQLLMGE